MPPEGLINSGSNYQEKSTIPSVVGDCALEKVFFHGFNFFLVNLNKETWI